MNQKVTVFSYYELIKVINSLGIILSAFLPVYFEKKEQTDQSLSK